MRVFSAFSETRNKGETTLIRNRKRKQRKREKHRKRFQIAIESRKQLTDEQISLLSRGLKFIPTPATNEGLIRRNLLKHFNLFARRMRLQYIFTGKKTNNTLSTLNQHGNHRFNNQWPWKPSYRR